MDTIVQGDRFPEHTAAANRARVFKELMQTGVTPAEIARMCRVTRRHLYRSK